MLHETVQEFIARGGQIKRVPMGATGQNINKYEWSSSSMAPLSNPELPTYEGNYKAFYKGKEHEPTVLQNTYLQYINKNPNSKPRHAAIALNWRVSRVNNIRKSCIRGGFINTPVKRKILLTNGTYLKQPTETQQKLLDHLKVNPRHKRREIAKALGWPPEKVGDTRKRCIASGYLDTTRVDPIRTSTKKQCTACKTLLPFKKFNKNKLKSDGLQTLCAMCATTAMRELRARKKARSKPNEQQRFTQKNNQTGTRS